MAYTVSFLGKTVHGNERTHHLRVTADASTGVIASGFDVITTIGGYCPQSATSAPKFAINELAAGTASAGNIGISGAVSGDEYLLSVYGV